MNDDLRLSLFVDGRLAADERAALEARLAREPALRARLDALRRLQSLSEGLAVTRAGFSGADVAARAPRRPARGRAAALAAAAVLVLALSHGIAFRLGQTRAAPPADPLAETAALLRRARDLDAGAPPEHLKSQLVDLRNDLRPLPGRLHASAAEYAPEQRDRLRRFNHALESMEIAFEQFEDPGFLGIALAGIARDSLEEGAPFRFLPASATSYSRLAPLRGGRFRLIVVTSADGLPRTLTDVGTLEELRRRHPRIEFVEEGE